MYHFIINPSSSSGGSQDIWRRLERILKDYSVSYEAHILSYPMEASMLVSRLTQDPQPCTIVVVGGDGTINEVLGGIQQFDHVTFACIPTGSGNDFCKGLGIPRQPEAALLSILNPSSYRDISIGTVTDGRTTRRFAISSGMGFDADVTYGVARSRIKGYLNAIHAGQLSYTLVALRQLLFMKRQPMRIILDGKELIQCRKAYFTASMNLPYEGGGFRFCPDADPEDDHLDLCIVDDVPRILVPFCLPLAYFGLHVHIPGIRIATFRRAIMQNETPLCVHTDGEPFGFCGTILIQVLPQRLKVITG